MGQDWGARGSAWGEDNRRGLAVGQTDFTIEGPGALSVLGDEREALLEVTTECLRRADYILGIVGLVEVIETQGGFSET